jgi:hypothetical protein
VVDYFDIAFQVVRELLDHFVSRDTGMLLGDANSWLPRWLDRSLPRMSLENGAAQAEAEREKVVVG